MKIGVSAYSFAKYMKHTGCNYKDICALAREIGFEGIEFIDFNPEISGKSPLETAEEIRSHCAEIGLEIICYAVHANLLEDDVQAEVERLKGCVDIAAALGVSVMRHDVCWKPKDVPGYTWQDAIKDVAPHVRTIADYAASKGIRTCTENHGQFIQQPERMEALMRAVNHPNYGWLVDMGNFICADVDSLQAVATAIPYAVHVHAKDFLFKPGTEPYPGEGWFMSRGQNHLRGTIVGHGVIPVRQCVAMFKSAGYDQWLSLEFEGLEDNMTALKSGYAYLKKCVEA